MNNINKASYSTKDVQIKAREFLFRGFIQVEKVTLTHRLFNQPHSSPILHRELIHRPEAAGVFIYNHQCRQFALIEQFRIGALDDSESPWQLEIVAGVLDGQESAESCIRRESQEEAGCNIHDLQHLFSFYPSAGACSELFHLYVAQADLPADQSLFGMADEGEDIKLHIFNYDQAETLLSSGRLRNSPVIMAVQWLIQHIRASQHNVRNVPGSSG